MSWAGSGAFIIDHMARSSAPGEGTIPDVLRRLIGGGLAALADRHAETDLATAVTVIEDALDTLAGEIYLFVPDETGDDFTLLDIRPEEFRPPTQP